jgi:hypothetical protein
MRFKKKRRMADIDEGTDKRASAGILGRGEA